MQKAPTLLNQIHDIISLRGDEVRFALSGSEIDFIWQRGKQAIGVEVKNSAIWRPDSGKSMRPLLREKKLTRGLVVYRGKQPTLADDVEGLPFEDFLSRLWQGEILG